jgi:hypothetical protein
VLTPGLLLIVIVAGAYLAARSMSEWLARRFLIVSGAEYLLLGVLLGPEVSGAIQATTVDGFAPFLTLAFGWVGALVGAQFHFRDLVRIPAEHFRIAWTEAALVLGAASGITAGIGVWWFDTTWAEMAVPAVAVGAIAVASAPTGIAVVSRKLAARGFLVRQLQITPAIDALVAIVAFGLVLALAHEPPDSSIRPPTPTEWTVITLAIGLASGVLFHLFVAGERKIDRLFIALAGALILSSGAAAYLRLSPMLPALLMGFILVNTSPARDELREVLARVERPLYFVLLIFAGAALRVEGSGWVLVATMFVLVRIVAKVGAAAVAGRTHRSLPSLGIRWGWGLVGHGGLAVAIALNYRLFDSGPLAGLIFAAAILSVLVTDVLSAWVVRGLVLSAPDPVAKTEVLEVADDGKGRAQRLAKGLEDDVR